MRLRIHSYLRLLLAFALAPLVGTFVVPVGNCLLVLFGNGTNCVAGVTGYVWYGLLPAALATALIGAPLLFIVLRAGWVKAWQFVTCGAGVGACASLLLGLADHHLDTLGVLTIVVPTSAVAAGVVWIVGVHRNWSSDGTTA